MITVNVRGRSKKISVDEAWNLLTDIEKYPGRVKYVKKVQMYGEGEGSKWDDVTTILGVPLKMNHTVTSYKKNKEYAFELPLKFGGVMVQKFELLKESPSSTKIEGTISYDLGNKMLNMTLGVLLKRRLRRMLADSITNIGAELL